MALRFTPLLAAAALLAAPAGAFAAPFELDPGFLTGGRGPLTLPASGEQQSGGPVLPAPGGGAYVLNQGEGPDGMARAVVARLGADGRLDPAFGDGGTAVIATEDRGVLGFGMTLDGQGRIVVAGGAYDVGSDLVVARVTPAGDLDASFSGDGIATAALEGFDLVGLDAAVDGDGRVVVAGQSWAPLIGTDFAVLRFDASGARDETYGDEGLVTAAFGVTGDGDYASAVVARPDGSAVVAGTYQPDAGDRDVALLGLQADGSPDPAFGAQGERLVDLDDGSWDALGDLAALPGGGVVGVGGVRPRDARTRAAIVRFSAAGELASLKAVEQPGGWAFAEALDVDAAGAVTWAGSVDLEDASGEVVTHAAVGDETEAMLLGLEGPLGSQADGLAWLAGGGLLVAGTTFSRDPEEGGTGDDIVLTRLRRPGGGEEPVEPEPTPTATPATPAPPVTTPPPGGSPAPSPGARPGSVTRRRIAGTAQDAARVQVAVTRLGSAKRCRRLTGVTGRLDAARGRKRCAAPRWVTATGAGSWALKLRRKLPRGRYVVRVRAMGADGRPQAGPPARRTVKL